MRTLVISIALSCAALMAGCKRTSAPVPDAAAPTGARTPPRDASLAPAAPTTARFVSVAELRRHPLFQPFAEFVEVDDDLEESTSSAMGEEEEAEDVSADRPPSDLGITRLALPGEVYALSYEENCGEGLEDRRNLHHVLLERRQGELREVLRKPLCGEAERGFSIDLVDLLGRGARDLLVRSWIIDPDGASEHAVSVFRPTAGGLAEVGRARDAAPDAERFDASYPRAAGGTFLEIGVHLRQGDSAIPVRKARRYRIDRSGRLYALFDGGR